MKNVLICGAGKGIGRSCAEKFSKNGFRVWALSRTEKDLIDLKKEFPLVEVISVDLLKEESIEKINDLKKNYGSCSIIINNAGGPPAGPLLEANEDNFQKYLTLHVLRAHQIVKLMIEDMKRHSFGRIINIISTSVKTPLPSLGVSNTIRGAMANWSKTLANEVGSFGITVNNILPGATNTQRLEAIIQGKMKKLNQSREEVVQSMLNIIPAKRFGKADEMASLAFYLASEEASYINGVSIPVDGGRTSSL